MEERGFLGVLCGIVMCGVVMLSGDAVWRDEAVCGAV